MMVQQGRGVLLGRNESDCVYAKVFLLLGGYRKRDELRQGF